MFCLRVLALLPVCWVLVAAEVMNVFIDGNTKLCNTTHKVGNDTTTITAKGNIPGANCKLTFNTEDSKCGICFQFEKYAFFNSSMASLDVTAGSKSAMINSMKVFPTAAMCSDSNKMTFTLMHESGYVYDANEPGYTFTLDVYNKCSYRGSSASVSFDDVKDKATGYHHGEEKASREQQTLVTGLVVAICLACVFLIILLVGYCYVKNSPNRGASKSVGMPKGKNRMDMGAAEQGQKPDVEMTAYKSKGADRPEGKPLLTGAAVAVAVTAKEDKKKTKKERKGSASSSSSSSSDDEKAEEKKQLIEQEKDKDTSEPTKDTSEPSAPSGGDSGHVGGSSSDHTSSGVGSSDHTSSGVGSSDYTSGGGYSGGYSGGSDFSYSGGGGGGGGSSCGGGGGGGGSSCGGGGGADD